MSATFVGVSYHVTVVSVCGCGFPCSRRHIPEPEVVYERGEAEEETEEDAGKGEEGEREEEEEEEEEERRVTRHVHHIAPSSSER